MPVTIDGTTGITTPALDAAAVNAGNDVGQVATFAMNTAPSGWLKANGAAVSRTTYAALFAAIGTTFGAGNGSTTFLLPDMRGEFARGWDDGRGVDSGRAFGSAQLDAFQGHRHGVNAIAIVVGNVYNNSPRAEGGSSVIGDPTTDTVNGTPRTASETRPRNVALLACIKF